MRLAAGKKLKLLLPVPYGTVLLQLLKPNHVLVKIRNVGKIDVFSLPSSLDVYSSTRGAE
jgi:hypothetical protein